MRAFTIRRREDVLRLVPHVLGFCPSQSLVVLGIGEGAPTARVDLTPAPLVLEALRPAFRHWSGQRVVLVVYGTPPDDGFLTTIEDVMGEADIDIVDVIEAEQSEVVPTGIAEIDAGRVLASREALEAEAAQVSGRQGGRGHGGRGLPRWPRCPRLGMA